MVAVGKRLQNGDFLERMNKQNLEKSVERKINRQFLFCENSVRPRFTVMPPIEKTGNLPQIGKSKFKSTPNKISINLLLHNTYCAYPFCSTGQ